MWRKRFILMIMVALTCTILFFMFWLVPHTQASHAQRQLNALMDEIQAPPYTREAYLFALSSPEVLKALPCFCGCAAVGHQNNFNCFFTNQHEFDPHGLSCGMCVQIALYAKQMHQSGADRVTIRRTIDKTYAHAEHQLVPTPTPMPSN